MRFVLGLELYWSDVEEKISLGNTRIKKRKKAVMKEKETALDVTVPGMFVEKSKYAEKYGDPDSHNHTLHRVHDPLQGKEVEAVFIPKHEPGIFEGSLRATKALKMAENLDDNQNALRDSQVQQSFQSQASSFSKSLPSVQPAALTYDAINNKKEVEPEEEQQNEEDWQNQTVINQKICIYYI